MNLPKNYISYNQIRQYQTCPKKYYFSYIKEIQIPINEKIFLGTVFHSVVEYYLQKQIEGQVPENEEVLNTFSERFNAGQKKNDIIWKTPVNKNKERGISFIKYFLNDIAPSIEPLMVEKELEVDVPEIGIKLRGIIDLVEKDFSITDFKTTTSKWSKERINSSFLQMVIYKYLFEQSFGNIGSELKFIIVYSKNSLNIKHQQLSMKSEDANLNKMFDIIDYVVQNVSNGVFYKKENYFCNFCDFKDLCKKNSC